MEAEVEHLLHGIMLEPLEKFRPTLSADINKEINRITSCVGGDKDYIEAMRYNLDIIFKCLEKE